MHHAHRRAADKARGELADESWVIADPGTNAGLRIAEAARRLTARAVRVATGAGTPGRARPFVATRRPAIAPRLQRLNLHTRMGLKHVMTVEGATRDAYISMSPAPAAEVLIGLARAERDVGMAEDLSDAVSGELLRLGAGERRRAAADQVRVVDVTLQRLTRDLTEPTWEIWVGSDTTLRRGDEYRLVVRIGEPSVETLVVGPRRPIDPLLRSSKKDGHDLDVVVFGHDFEVTGPGRRRIHLPRVGPSDLALFDISAPSDGDARSGQLRIAVFHENHLIQSLLLTAAVADREQRLRGPERAVEVKVEVSRAGTFEDVGSLEPRLLSLGLNASGSGTHRVWLSGADAHDDVTLPELALDDEIKWFRGALKAATGTGASPRFPSWPQPGATPSPAFHVHLQELARGGAKIHRALFRRMVKLRKPLRAAAGTTDEVIQIIWHDRSYAFPWSVVYDSSSRRGRRGPSSASGTRRAIHPPTASRSSSAATTAQTTACTASTVSGGSATASRTCCRTGMTSGSRSRRSTARSRRPSTLP